MNSFVLSPILGQILLWLYGLATLVQLVLWCCVFGKLGRWTPNARKKQSLIPAPSFSIVICARNESENLRRNLPSVLAQQYDGPWELILVDDASEDETPVVLRFFQEKNPGRLRVLRIAEKTTAGKKNALAQGIALAKYDLLLLSDADCEPASPYWLAHMSAMLTTKLETEIVLGYGPNFVGPRSGQTTWSRQAAASTSSDDLESSDEYAKKDTNWHWPRYETAFVATQYFSFALAGMPYMGVGRNLAFKRQAYDRVGGFAAHAHIPSGDDDLFVNAAANAQNTAICLDPESFVYSKAPSNLRSWLQQKRRHLGAGKAYRWPHKMMLAMVGLSQVGHYFLFTVLILADFSPKVVIALFLLRLFSVLFVFGKILRVLGEPRLFWRVPLFDPLLAVYYGAVTPWFLIRKNRVKWR